MFLRCTFVLSAAALLLGECALPPEARESKVEVLAVDLRGQPVANPEVEFFRDGSRVAEITTKSPVNRVLYGEYRLKVHAQGFRSAWRDIVVHQPAMTVRLELELGSVGCPPPPTSIGGTIKRDDSTQELWVKTIPVRGTGGGESRVSNSGYFLISGLQPSAYVVLIMREEAVLYSAVVRTMDTDTSKLLLDIRDKH